MMQDLQEIYVLNKRLKLLHTMQGFKTSIDSVLLAAACPAKAGDKLLDLGCGVGGAGLSVLTRVDGIYLTGVEIQSDHVVLAYDNTLGNGFQDQCEFIHADIRDYKNENMFHHVICNPPYLEAGHHLRSPSEENAIAMGGLPPLPHTPLPHPPLPVGEREERSEGEGGVVQIKDWIDAAHDALKSNGSLTIIHRADKIDKIIQGLGKRFGAVEIIPLYPKIGEAAKRVIVRAIKHRKSPATLHAGLILHRDDGGYTDEAERVLRNCEGLLL